MTRWLITFLLTYEGCNRIEETACEGYETQDECDAHRNPNGGCVWSTLHLVTDVGTCEVESKEVCVEMWSEVGGCVDNCGDAQAFSRETPEGVEVLVSSHCGPRPVEGVWAEADGAAAGCVCE